MSKRGFYGASRLSGPSNIVLICINALYSRPLTRKQFEFLGSVPVMAENVTKVPVKQERIRKALVNAASMAAL